MIYFIKMQEFVKIGFTTNISKRLYSLQSSSPIKVEVIGLIEGSKDVKKELHEKFKSKYVNGEWFILDDEILSFIDSQDDTLMWKYGFTNQHKSVIGLIKEKRLENNITMEDLAKMLNITKQSVSEMELREVQGRITIKYITNVANILGYKFEYRFKKI